MWWVVAVVALVVLGATYLTWLAARVDRLHARAAGASTALDAQLRRRAVLAAAVAERVLVARPDDSGAAAVRSAARTAVDSAPPDREAAENELTRRLRQLDPDDPDMVDDLDSVGRRVALARQVHTDLVRDALGVRRQRIVRLVRLARRHPAPAYFDIDDPSPGEPTGVLSVGTGGV
ncbi:hypothetical protein [Actinocatenispora rupis]|uniref:NUDIX hydrolase n=1 Tax=Actinocatenispora rupis TaxID=519421 RepID=A0A8J3J6X2_9ACTN|nr:hypothetical protein [Actinocatenispora rupis]GID09633.1 hypothetical protein Aru02nite_05220 [Actinocatenispora rupis]